MARMHFLQHVPFEGPANFGSWADRNSFTQTVTHLYRDESLPAVNVIDWLVILGGPMGVGDEDAYPWLVREKEYIHAAISAGKTVLGVCLGGQLIAEVLGATVTRSPSTEVGWHEVTLTEQAEDLPFLREFYPSFVPFHWHGDMFGIPDGAVRFASSEGCPNQGFALAGNVVAMQYHLEYSFESVVKMLENCGDDLGSGGFIQHPVEMMFSDREFIRSRYLLDSMLYSLAGLTG
ncbi:MAG: type 1 glutamine amidotransferase [Phycisphaerae bacterium]